MKVTLFPSVVQTIANSKANLFAMIDMIFGPASKLGNSDRSQCTFIWIRNYFRMVDWIAVCIHNRKIVSAAVVADKIVMLSMCGFSIPCIYYEAEQILLLEEHL